jgi:uncharacterized protein YgbK (DUF1537 family)
MTADETSKVHAAIGNMIALVAREKRTDFIIISRSDSTLRGHYPLETEVLREVIEKEQGFTFDGEIICPFFKEGGRYTIGDIHYVLSKREPRTEGPISTGMAVSSVDILTPAAKTEFAADRTFGYRHSNLREWVEEKTNGAYPKEGVRSISLEDLRSVALEKIIASLRGVHNFEKIVVNALDYQDIKVFCTALLRTIEGGKHFILRSAAAVPKVLGGVTDQALLNREDLIDRENKRGGLIVIGSHVQKTTRQLELLLEDKDIEAIEFDTHLVINEERFADEIRRVQGLCNAAIDAGKTTAVFTRRERFDLNTGNREDELRMAMKIAAAVTGFVSGLGGKPRFIIAKGGITSSEIGTAALKVKKALVLGQVLPGIPVWLTGPESRFPHMPYIIFPGNVGDEDSLKKIVTMLK